MKNIIYIQNYQNNKKKKNKKLKNYSKELKITANIQIINNNKKTCI